MQFKTYFEPRFQIGLFGLTGLLGVLIVPLAGYLIDRLLPWAGLLISILTLMSSQSLLTAAAKTDLVVPILGSFGTSALNTAATSLQLSLNNPTFIGLDLALQVKPLARLEYARTESVVQQIQQISSAGRIFA